MGNQGRIEQFETLLAEDPHSDLLRYALGNEYLKAGRFDDAAESFRAAIRLNPNTLLPTDSWARPLRSPVMPTELGRPTWTESP